MITAAQCFNFLQCPHRVALDLRGDPLRKEEPNAFVELLWEGGLANKAERTALMGISGGLGLLPLAEREAATRAAMAQGQPLIYQGRLTAGDRVAEPDFLEKHPDGYRAGDLKSGCAFAGDTAKGRLKKNYAVRLAHCTSVLDELGLSDGSGQAFIIDGKGQRADYALSAAQGVRTPESWMDAYSSVLDGVRQIDRKTLKTSPALSATCKLCDWKSHCKKAAIATNDLSLIAEFGRGKRDALQDLIPTVKALADANLEDFTRGKKTVFPGISPKSLRKFQERAQLLSTPDARPYLTEPLNLPVAEREVFFDIEADSLHDSFVYLHGFVERRHNRPETAQFLPYITPDTSPEAEETAFRQSWEYLCARLTDSVIYFYSPYEHVAYKALAERFPAVCSGADVDALFSHPHVIDLYTDVVRKSTVWPLHDLSIKTLAVYLGFSWRDSNPSGAASIEWFNEWVNSGDPAILNRITIYNEDDCLATGVVLDGIRRLYLKDSAEYLEGRHA